ncbi:hypothetical protein H2198_008949 [Neophaeococcomyces mojaviensis]|uniref:Uncharacterized protein n=1 Tax=Neophaeococcomyces mojaviensis TaxID=3383035 RepID=A0ACC2ZVT7_9EURO|nr:hypothetical protein H2198_008949 [Knufia sp. JES_112]
MAWARLYRAAPPAPPLCRRRVAAVVELAVAQEMRGLPRGIGRHHQATVAGAHHAMVGQPRQAGLGQCHGAVGGIVDRPQQAAQPMRYRAGDQSDFGLALPVRQAIQQQLAAASQRQPPAMLGQRARSTTAAQRRAQADHALHIQLRLAAQGLQREQPTQAVTDQRQRPGIGQPLQQLRHGYVGATEHRGVTERVHLKTTRAQAPGQRPDPGAGIPDAMQQQYGGSHANSLAVSGAGTYGN